MEPVQLVMGNPLTSSVPWALFQQKRESCVMAKGHLQSLFRLRDAPFEFQNRYTTTCSSLKASRPALFQQPYLCSAYIFFYGKKIIGIFHRQPGYDRLKAFPSRIQDKIPVITATPMMEQPFYREKPYRTARRNAGSDQRHSFPYHAPQNS